LAAVETLRAVTFADVIGGLKILRIGGKGLFQGGGALYSTVPDYLKFTHALLTGGAPILLRVETKSGHGGGAPIAMTINEWADVYAFLVKNLDFTPKLAAR